MDLNQVTEKIIGAAIEVHRLLGPGLLESSYQKSLEREFTLSGIPFKAQVPLPVFYKGVQLDCGYILDFLVLDKVVVEIKSIERFEKVHDAQLLTYLRLGKWPVGLLINFNSAMLVDGIRRRVLNFDPNAQ